MPQKRKFAALSLVALVLCAQSVEPPAQIEKPKVQSHTNYSVAISEGKTPADFLADLEAQIEQLNASQYAEFRRFLMLPNAAKYALEAGQNDKAERYAEEALKFLERHPNIPMSARGCAVFYCNMVLGRLALLNTTSAQLRHTFFFPAPLSEVQLLTPLVRTCRWLASY